MSPNSSPAPLQYPSSLSGGRGGAGGGLSAFATFIELKCFLTIDEQTTSPYPLFILFIAIAFSTGCDDNTASQNNNTPPQDTVFLTSEFKKVTITYSNVLVIEKHKQLTNYIGPVWTDTVTWSYDKSYCYRASDFTKLRGPYIFINTTQDQIYGKSSFSGYYLKNKNEIAVLMAGYSSEYSTGSESCKSSMSISLQSIPFLYQQDSSIHVSLKGKEAEEYIVTISDYNRYHKLPSSSHIPGMKDEIENMDSHQYYQCTDSTQIEITLQR